MNTGKVPSICGSDEEDWVFLIKLGLSVDDSGDPPEREHLWFQVHSITDDEIDATLINEPYGIAAMHEGDRATHSLEPMSDWTILCEHGRFDPDTIFHLEQELEAEA